MEISKHILDDMFEEIGEKIMNPFIMSIIEKIVKEQPLLDIVMVLT